MVLLYALVTILSWGIWLVPSQSVRFRREFARTFYVSLANLLLTSAIWIGVGGGLSLGEFLIAMACGAFWILGAVTAFSATRSLGIARAFGIWSPLNVIVSVIWGAILWGEIVSGGSLAIALALTAIAVAALGIRMIATSGGASSDPSGKQGLLYAALAGLFWGSYFIPMQIAELSPWTAAFPMAIGMLAGATVLNASKLSDLKIDAGGAGYALAMLSGVLWGVGNFASLRLMELVGTGVGFTLAQLCLIVNALAGIYFFKTPPPGSRAAAKMLLGSLIALGGAVALFFSR